MKKRYWFLGIILLLVLVYLLGPKKTYPAFDANLPIIEVKLEDLDAYISNKEAQINNLKPNNESQIIWADSVRKTAYSIVYLHGFSASPMEGAPVHLQTAARYGCNMYLHRIKGHGINDSTSFVNLTPGDMIDAAKEALVIGEKLGEKVILMSASTGSTLSIYLATEHPDKIEAMLMYSPNIDLAMSSSRMLTKPWGLPLVRWMAGGNIRQMQDTEGEAANYWTTRYHIAGLVALRELVDRTMTDERFKALKTPFFMGYYYEDEENQDSAVSVAAMRDFFTKVSTPTEKKVELAFPKAKAHVITSKFRSQDLEGVANATYQYMEEVLGMHPVSK